MRVTRFEGGKKVFLNFLDEFQFEIACRLGEERKNEFSPDQDLRWVKKIIRKIKCDFPEVRKNF